MIILINLIIKTKHLRKIIAIILLILFIASNYCGAERVSTSNENNISLNDSTSVVNSLPNLPNKFFNKINNKTSSLNKQLNKQTEKYIRKLTKLEARLKKELYKSDSLKATVLFSSNPEQQYLAFAQKLKKDSAGTIHSMGTEYLPFADSLGGTLAFLNKNPQLLSTSNGEDQAKNALNHLQQLETKLQDADQLKTFIQQRRNQIKEALSKYTGFPASVSKIYNKYSQEQYYYSEQVRQYRQILNDPDKMLMAALSLLNKIPAFTEFMKNNSFLAGLLRVPANYGGPGALSGLQTRDQVLAIIHAQVASGGPNASSAIQSSLQSAQQDINKMKDKISKLGGGSGDMDMPDFKPVQQKTKTFLQRLEYGTNLQTQHAAYYFPTTTDLGLSVGYKISDKNTIGIGASYKVGWGKDLQHVSVTSEGVGLRSFADIQAKKSFYLSGGFEYNYQPLESTGTATANSWRKSGLLGLSKIVSMNTKVFKKTKVQLLWDFLSYEQPREAEHFKFRVGYNF